MTDADPAPRPSTRLHWQNWRVPALILVALGLLFVFRPSLDSRFGQGPRPEEHPTVGLAMPLVELEGLTGTAQPITLDDLKGRVVLINFWGTWCGPCTIELPHIAEIGRKLADREDFRLVAISYLPLGGPEDIERLRTNTAAFLKRAGIHLPTYADPGLVTATAFDHLIDQPALGAFPTTVLLDRKSIIRGVWVGYARGTEREMEEMVTRLLDEQG